MALSANKFDNYKPSKFRKAFPCLTNIVFYRGALLMIDANGYLTIGADTASCSCAGVALSDLDMTGISSGAKSLEVDCGGCEVKVTQSDGSMTQANVGDSCVVNGDDAVKASGNVPAGRVSEIVDADTVWVKLYGFGTIS